MVRICLPSKMRVSILITKSPRSRFKLLIRIGSSWCGGALCKVLRFKTVKLWYTVDSERWLGGALPTVAPFVHVYIER
jgi:hypothetical protein